MANLSDCPRLLPACFGALINLLPTVTDQVLPPLLPPHRQKMNGTFLHSTLEMGGIEMILEAMKTFPNDENLQYRACVFLSGFATDLCVRNRIREAKAFGSVDVTLDSYPDHTKFASTARSFLDQMLGY